MVHEERQRAVEEQDAASEMAEEALAAAHRQIRSIVDNSPAIVYAFDLIDVSNRFLGMCQADARQ